MTGWNRPYAAVPYGTLNSGDMGASITGATVDVSDSKGFAFQVTYTNAHSAVGTFNLQYSMDGTVWSTVASTAVDSTLDSSFDVVDPTSFQYARVNYARTSGGSGDTVTATFRKTLKV